jgi:multidrug efflux pump subunit AcrA (membrane-fusion protein)
MAALAVVSGCSKQREGRERKPDEAPKAIQVEAVRQERVARSVDVVGTLAAEDQVTIASQADGTVSRVLVDLGDRVRTGQVLVELDREKLEYTLESQKAALARALARYGAASPDQLPDSTRIPDVQRAAAELDQSRQAFDRAVELHKRQLIPRQVLDDADATLRAKQAVYDAALQNAKNLAADIDVSSAELKLADRQLRDASIRAPFDGYVQKRLVSLGEFVKNQTPVMTLVRMDSLKAIGEIPEKMAPWVQVGQVVDVTVDAFPGETIKGRISRLSPAVDTETRAFGFEALVPNVDGRLKPGTFARVHLTTALVEPVLTIPYAAMQYRYGVYRAFTVEGDRLAMRELKTGDRVGDRMEVLEGVTLGQLVALTDVDTLSDGLTVAAEPVDVRKTGDLEPGAPAPALRPAAAPHEAPANPDDRKRTE